MWDRESDIPRGKVVVGVARAFNNTSGYYHVGISLGNGRIVSLSGDVNLHIKSVGDLFSRLGYSEVRIADYNWRTSQAVPGPAAAPVAPVASAGVAAVGSPGRSK